MNSIPMWMICPKSVWRTRFERPCPIFDKLGKAILTNIAPKFTSKRTSRNWCGSQRCRGRCTAITAHRCPGYRRIEITLTANMTRSAVVSHSSLIPHEICPVCKKVAKDTDVFNFICGGESEWMHNCRFLKVNYFSRWWIYAYCLMDEPLWMASLALRNFFLNPLNFSKWVLIGELELFREYSAFLSVVDSICFVLTQHSQGSVIFFYLPLWNWWQFGFWRRRGA